MSRRQWLAGATWAGWAAGIVLALALAPWGRPALPVIAAWVVGGVAAGRLLGALTWRRVGLPIARVSAPADRHRSTNPKENR